MRGVLVAVGLIACGRVGFDPRDAGLRSDAAVIPATGCGPLPVPAGTLVSDTASLVAALASARPDEVILLADGTYPVTQPLRVVTPGVRLQSASGDATRVLIDGGGTTVPVVQAGARGLQFVAITIASGADEGLVVEPLTGADAPGVIIYDVTFRDNVSTGLRVKPFNTLPNGPYADDGVIACSRFVMSAQGVCSGLGTFGVRIMASRGWTVRDNYFAGRCSPARSRAVWIDEGSRDPIVIGNLFVDNMNNILLGGASNRTYPDPLPSNCAGTPQVWGGVVCNNRIAGLGVPPRAGVDFDEGIVLWEACDTWVVHNTVVAPAGAETFGELEVRYPPTYVHVLNNLLGRPVLERDGGRLDPASQTMQYSALGDFVDPAGANLRLAPGNGVPPGASIAALSFCLADADGRIRPTAVPTPGAYER